MYHVEDLCIDDELFELRRRHRAVPIEPLALELILYLLKHRHRLVPKEELVAQLWPGTRVTESALPRCVCVARKALGAPWLIKTVYKRGYRWNGPPERNAGCALPAQAAPL